MRGPKIKCVLQKAVRTSDDMGNWTTVYNDLVEFNAVLICLSAKEKVFFDKDTVFADYSLRADYRAVHESHIDEVKEGNRIKYGERTFDIKGVKNPGEQNRFWSLDLLETKGHEAK